MGLFSSLRQSVAVAIGGSTVVPLPRASLETFGSLNDPHLQKFIRGAGGGETSSGAFVTPETAMRVSAVNASVRILSTSAAMLPLPVFREVEDGQKERATDLPLWRLLRHRPNSWQTPLQFRSMMTAHMLLRGNAYAAKVKDGMGQVAGLIPLHPDRVKPEQRDDLSIVYKWTRRDGRTIEFQQGDVFHLADWYTSDGFLGKSRIEMERESIGWSLRAQEAGARLYRNGVMAGGGLKTPNTLSDKARNNILDSLKDKYSGAENAHKWLLLEEGLEPVTISASAKDMQFIETMNFQVIDIARVFGVPPHLIGAVEKTTSWGSGIEQQSIGFVQFSLQPIAVAWEQTISRDCIPESEQDTVYAKHNFNALLRGSLKDQSDAFAKALGSGGHRPWMTINEVRALQEMNKDDDPQSDTLQPPVNAPAPGNNGEQSDDDPPPSED